jgi:ribosome biogenesis protein BMS1
MLTFINSFRFNVEIPKFYASVTNLLLPEEDKLKWKGMRTVGQIKRDKGIKMEANPDNLYTKIVREPKVFNDLQIPRNLQRDLPYNFKPKHLTTGGKKDKTLQRVAVVLEPEEKKVVNHMKVLRTLFQEKEAKQSAEKTKRVETMIRKVKGEEERKFKKQKEARKLVARAISKAETKKQKFEARSGGGSRKRKRE